MANFKDFQKESLLRQIDDVLMLNMNMKQLILFNLLAIFGLLHELSSTNTSTLTECS